MTAEQLFGLRVSLGLLMGGWFLYWTAQRQQHTVFRHWADVYLLTILSGLTGARLFYVLDHWSFFRAAPTRIPRLWYGELHWEGALICGGVAMFFLCRWRKIPLTAFGDAVALALPVGLMGLAWGCRAVGCMLGQEVARVEDYPVWQVGYLRDLSGFVYPRYELQMLGIWLGLLLLLLMGWITLQDRLIGRRLWLSLGLIGLAGIVLGGGYSAVTLTVSGGLGLIWSVKRVKNVVSATGQNPL